MALVYIVLRLGRAVARGSAQQPEKLMHALTNRAPPGQGQAQNQPAVHLRQVSEDHPQSAEDRRGKNHEPQREPTGQRESVPGSAGGIGVEVSGQVRVGIG
jgi:hypothetical protein